MKNRTLGALACVLAAALPGAASGQAAAFPVKPIRVIVPFTPGGPADAVARPIAQGLTERWGQQAIVDYRAGAGGSIGAETLAKSPPDGYTIMVTTPGIVAVYPAMVSKAPFDTLRDNESGLPGYEVVNWMGIIAPSKTPRDIVGKLSAEIRAVISAPEARERLLKQGLEPAGNTPEAFDAYIRSEIDKWSRVVRQAGLKPD